MIATSPLRTIRKGCIVCLVVSGGLFSAAHAADRTWDGGGTSDDWSDGGNWGGTPPATDGSDGLVFDGSTRLTPNNDFVGATFDKIYFNEGASAFVLDGNSLRLQNVSNGIRNISTVEQTINLDIELLDSSIPFAAIGTDLTINGNISGVGGILPTADNWVNLNGANTFTGGISLSGSGARKLRVGHASGLGAGTLTVSGGQLAFKAGIGEFSVGLLGGSTGTFSLTDEDGQAITLTVTGSGTANRGNVMSGTGALRVALQPDGMQILSGTNTYTGGTIVESGTLELNGASGNIAPSGALVVNGGTLSIQRNASAKSVTVASLNGTGGEIVANTLGTVTFTVNTTTDDAFAGTLRDGSSQLIFNKAGSGTLTLSGTNTHSGLTTVSGGLLNIDGTFANSSLSVLSGAALGGNGGTIANSVTIGNGGAMAFTLENASETNLTIGAATLGDNVDLRLALGYAALVGDTFQLVDAVAVFGGEFATINGEAFGPGNTFNLTFGENSYAFELTYQPNGVMLEVVPEPQTMGLLLIAVGAFALGWRRHASKSRKNPHVA